MKRVYQRVIDSIPDYQTFNTLDEFDASTKALAEEFPGVVELSSIGKTREGRDLLCLKIGEGPAALALGCPHPNEPIGAMMLEHFSRCLAADEGFRRELGYTWYIVKAWDADSLVLNKWLKGPYTITNYTRGFFRPSGPEMVEWSFPIDYKTLHFHDTLPETEAVMRLIDETKPAFIYSLHNSGFGGVYWYESEPTPDLWEEMRSIVAAQGLPLHLGEPEVPYIKPLAPATFPLVSVVDEYEYLERYVPEGTDPASQVMAGAGSEDYARKYGTFEFINEMPYFFDPRIGDSSPCGRSRRDVMIEALDFSEEANRQIHAILDLSKGYMDPASHFLKFVEAFSKIGSSEATRAMVATNPEFDRQATVAEEFDGLLVGKFYKTLQFAMLARANESELDKLDAAGLEAPEARAALLRGRDAALAKHAEFCAMLEEKINYEVIPIKRLVTIQLSCGLLVADEVRRRAQGQEGAQGGAQGCA